MSPPCKSIPQLFSKACQSKPKKHAKTRRDHCKANMFIISNPSSSSCKCQERVVQLSRLDRRSRSHKRETQQPTLPRMASRWATIFLLLPLALKHGTYGSDWAPSWQKLHVVRNTFAIFPSILTSHKHTAAAVMMALVEHSLYKTYWFKMI